MKLRNLIILTIFLFSINAAAQTEPRADSGVKLLSTPVFNLSDAAVAAGIEGKVVMALTVDEKGEVTKVYPIAGPMWPCGAAPVRELEELFVKLNDSVHLSKFSAAIKNGAPVASNIALTIDLDKTPQLIGRGKPELSEPTGQKPKKINAGVINGKAISLPRPPYPAEARAHYAKGIVSIAVLIDEKGIVTTAGATTGDPLLQAAARNAACLAKFSPTKVMNEPVKVSGIITYNFMP